MATKRSPKHQPAYPAGFVHVCAWNGCEAAFEGYPMPEDWRNMIVYWSAEPAVTTTLADIVLSEHCYRDANLCPEHARQLESHLKQLPRRPLVSAET